MYCLENPNATGTRFLCCVWQDALDTSAVSVQDADGRLRPGDEAISHRAGRPESSAGRRHRRADRGPRFVSGANLEAAWSTRSESAALEVFACGWLVGNTHQRTAARSIGDRPHRSERSTYEQGPRRSAPYRDRRVGRWRRVS